MMTMMDPDAFLTPPELEAVTAAREVLLPFCRRVHAQSEGNADGDEVSQEEIVEFQRLAGVVNEAAEVNLTRAEAHAIATSDAELSRWIGRERAWHTHNRRLSRPAG